jgi:two-component system cell cycle sensor histidine kinase/response regulator CckA
VDTGVPRRLLLVEDEAPLRRLAARALQQVGHQVDTAEDAEAALAWLDETMRPPDLLVSDVALPGMDGLALARAARARTPGLKVLLTSGYAESMLDQDLAAEGIGFLSKPYAPAALVAAVSAALPA